MVSLIFAGPIAIGALFSIAAVAAFVAFSIPIFIRVFLVGNRFRPGPWHLGKWSYPIGVLSCSFVALMVPILMLPASRGRNLNPTTMNWTCLVYGAPMTGVIIWWAVDAHKWFKGPKVNIEHQMMGRDEAGIQGNSILDGDDESSSRAGSLPIPVANKKLSAEDFA